jgi:hypothetical protein
MNGKYWSDEEDEMLRRGIRPRITNVELAKIVPGRTGPACRMRAHALGILAVESVVFERRRRAVRERWGKIPVTTIANNLKISVNLVRDMVRDLGLDTTLEVTVQQGGKVTVPRPFAPKGWDKRTIEDARNLRMDEREAAIILGTMGELPGFPPDRAAFNGVSA